MPRPCIVCGHTGHRVAFQEFDVAVLQCSACGHVFSSHESPQHFDGYFGDTPLQAADLFWWNEAHDRMYDVFCRRFLTPQGGRLLDVGCGLGYFVRRVSQVPRWESVGYEISPQAVEFARTTLGLTNVFAGSMENAGLPARSFNVITLWDVIEHIPNPDPLLSCVLGLLAEGGMLFLHTPNATIQLPKARLKKLLMGMRPDVHYLEARDHINIYSMRSLTAVLNRNGLHDVAFTHLPPIQSVSGARSRPLRLVKNAWCAGAAAVHRATLGHVNLDNLFAIASRGTR